MALFKSGWPQYDQDEIDAVTQVLRGGNVNAWQGKEVWNFQHEFAKRHKCLHGIAVANGTVALELALGAIGVLPGDRVIVTSRSFIASASCVVRRQAIPVFVDVDPTSQNITAETVEKCVTDCTTAIVAVHLGGWPCEMDKIMAVARKHGICVVEDCAQAHGAEYQGRPVGSWGDVAAFSFCQDKIISTGGEGGMVLTNDDNYWDYVWSMKDHGKAYGTCFQKQHQPGYRWLHEKEGGTNARMTEVQAAIGRVQLGKLDKWICLRRSNAEILNNGFSGVPGLRVTIPEPWPFYHTYYKYHVFVEDGYDRNSIMQEINNEGVPCFTGYGGPIYNDKAMGFYAPTEMNRCVVAEKLGNTGLQFLVDHTLTRDDMHKTVEIVDKVMRRAKKCPSVSS